MTMLNLVLKKHQQLIDEANTIWVAYSGGIDSTVLLHEAQKSLSNKTIHVIHINHRLQSESDQWAEHCDNTCQQFDLPLKIIELPSKPALGKSLETWARDERYRIFTDCLNDNDVMLLGHHADDQAETVLFNLFRGSGLKGLSDMPVTRSLGKGFLLRPLLNYTKKDLLNYAKHHDLIWIEDQSNTDIKHTRNFLRQEILPQLKKQWPQVIEKINQVAVHSFEDSVLIEDWAQRELSKVFSDKPLGGDNVGTDPCVGPAHNIEKGPTQGAVPKESLGIDLSKLSQYAENEQNHLIRAWLKSIGQCYPSRTWLKTLRSDVINVKPDSRPILTCGDGVIKRDKKQLYWVAK